MSLPIHVLAFYHVKNAEEAKCEIQCLLLKGISINVKNAYGNTPLDEALSILIMQQTSIVNNAFLNWLLQLGAHARDGWPHIEDQKCKPQVHTIKTNVKQTINIEELDRDNYYSLYWIIIRRVRRFRDHRFKLLYPTHKSPPTWYFDIYDEHHLEEETNTFAEYWTKQDQWKFTSIGNKI